MRRLMVWWLCLLLAGGSLASAQSDIDTEAIDRYITRAMSAHHLPGLGLAITRGDEALYVAGYGAGVTPRSQFFIASVSKSFTALGVMQLVEAGQVALDTPVQAYLPDFTLADERVASAITVRQLLNQTSGLADAGFATGLHSQVNSLTERVASLRGAEPVSAPGTTFHYFNPNYEILARLVEMVSGQPFADYMQANIFTPLAMPNTFSATTSGEAMERAVALVQGHLSVYSLPVPVDEMQGFLAGSGGIISTPEDMAHYLVAQNNGGQFAEADVITQESLVLMHTPPAGIDTTYAMGWIASEYNGVRAVEHNGILSAYYADVVLLPETGHGIALLYNVNALSASLLAFPDIKQGVIALLTGTLAETGPVTVQGYGVAMAMVTLAGVFLALRSLLRLDQWRARHQMTPAPRLLPGIVWAFVPAAVLLLLPLLVTRFTDRVFSAEQLVRYMLGISLWLGLTGILGIVNGLARLVFLLRRERSTG